MSIEVLEKELSNLKYFSSEWKAKRKELNSMIESNTFIYQFGNKYLTVKTGKLEESKIKTWVESILYSSVNNTKFVLVKHNNQIIETLEFKIVEKENASDDEIIFIK